jgi:thymidylate synthase ThyX
MAFADAGHRDHARHTGETPRTDLDRGPSGLSVTLDDWGPWNEATINRYLQSNWGERPMTYTESHVDGAATGSYPLVDAMLDGKTLQQVLEGVEFWFTIDGVCRPATHQIVRTRDAAYMQHGGRDNDWRHRKFTMPETIARLIDVESYYVGQRFVWKELKGAARAEAKANAFEIAKASTGKLCVTSYKPLDAFLDWRNSFIPDKATEPSSDLAESIDFYLQYGKRLYAALVDMGVPWQDARRLLPMGLQTYIHAIYDFRTLQHTLANRLEYIMDWEYNCVGQLMVRAIHMKCPAKVAKQFRSASDKLKRAAMAGLESWPPDGKWPVPDEHKDKPRTHRPEQNPFFVLTDDALHGGPVEWIATDGTYPHDNPKAPKAQ